MRVLGLGRRFAPDARDREYPLRALIAAPSVRHYRYWYANGWWGNQADSPQCVAYAWCHYLEDGPVMQTQPRTPPVVSPGMLYREAQKLDEWEGEDYDGTSVRAGAKVLQALGYLQSYRWGASVADVVDALLEVGPVVMGTNWYEDMFTPDDAGFLRVRGALAGGHAYVLDGVNRSHALVRLKNSWGREWGQNGFAFMAIEDLGRLLAEDGEACLGVEVKNPDTQRREGS
jgi:papain like protease